MGTALVIGGVARQVWRETEPGDMSRPLGGGETYVAAPASVVPGMTWDGQAWAAPPRVPTVDDVRAECERRIIAALGARDLQHAMLKEINTLRIGTAAEIAAMNALIDPLRAAADTIEALDPIPADYADDARWP